MHNTYAEQFREYINSPEEVKSVNAKNVLVVDGLNLFIRAFSVIPTLNQNGEHTGAVVGFYRTLSKLIRDLSIHKVIVAFDGKGGNARRRKLFKEYKEKRVSIGTFNRFEEVRGLVNEGESMKRQLFIVLKTLEHLPVHTVVIDGVEADDVIAYTVNELLEPGDIKIIVSSDKDYLQLISESIRVYSLHKKMLITDRNVHEVIGYLPENFLTLRCFTGDNSDNINGVFKVGEKSLTKYFGLGSKDTTVKIDDIIEESFKQVSAGIKTKTFHYILDQKYIAYRNYDLMQLKDPPISGILTSQIRRVLEQPLNSYNKLKFHENMKGSGIDYNLDDFTMWEKLAKL